MKSLAWVKMPLNLLSTAKMKYVRYQRNGKKLVFFWLGLQILAGEINDGGAIYLSSKIPFTAALLARHFSLSVTLVERALDLYEQLDMLSRDETGRLQILTWDDDQETEKLEAIRAAGRRRVAAYRQRKREAAARQEPATAVAEGQETAAAVEEETPAALPQTVQPMEPAALSPAVEAYQKAFGQVSFSILQALKDAEEDWGSERVCRAIRMAQYHNISRIPYIMGILRNGGAEEGAMTAYERPGVSDEEFERMLHEAGLGDDADLDEDGRGSLAGVS